MEAIHPAAIEHLPGFIVEPGQTDYLFNAVIVILVLGVLVVGNLYFKLHAIPEHRAHRTSKVQMEIVAVLALISLFTHNHLFWIAGLLLAFIQIPDFSTPLYSISQSLEKLSGRGGDKPVEPLIETEPLVEPAVPPSKVDTSNTQAEGI